MKILHTVQLYHPAIGGSEEVVRQISERLASRGHDVTVATARHKSRTSQIINKVKIVEFDISGNETLGIHGNPEAYKKFLLEQNFDIILNYGTQIWSTDIALPILSKIHAKKILIPVGFEGLKKSAYEKYYKKMPLHLKNYNKIIYLSEHYQDKKFSEKHGLKNGMVIPNAADENEFLKPSTDFRQKYHIKTPYLLLTVSNHYLLKRHYFLIDAFRKLKGNDVTLVIIGKNPVHFSLFSPYNCSLKCRIKSLLYKNLRILDNISREDTIAAFKAADLFIFGSQFECAPLVIFEAMASKTPFISTDCGNVKDFAAYGSIIQTPNEMAKKITEWLKNPSKCKKIGEAAFKNWQEHYTWEKITDRYEKLYESLFNVNATAD